MKLKALVAAACAVVAGQAFALSPSTTPDVTIYVSGSSAQLNSNQAVFDRLFVANTTDVYYDAASTGGSYRAYFGTVKATGTALNGSGTVTVPASIGGKKILVIERAAGGSFQGVGPVARAQAISFMAVNAANCTATGNAFPTVPTYNCGATTTNTVPHAGVSDVEPAMFTGPNLPSGQNALTSAELAKLTINAESGVVMGIAVSKNFPAALANKLSSAQITSILNGNYQDWSQVANSGISGPIIVQSRTAGSGTRAAAFAKFLNAPCAQASGIGGFLVNAPVQGDGSTVYTVVENGSGSGVKTGLNNAYAAGKVAIGILSTEVQPTASDNWQFLNVDGVAPTIANATSGAYDFFVEQSFQWRNAANGGPTGAELDYLNTFVKLAGDPTVLYTAGAGGTPLNGVIALPTVAAPSGDVSDAIIAAGSKLGNTCSAVQLF